MSAKKPRFEPRVGTAYKGVVSLSDGPAFTDYISVCVTDARDMTPAQAVRKVLQRVYSVHDSQAFIEHLARLVGMQAYLADGKVRVRRAKK